MQSPFSSRTTQFFLFLFILGGSIWFGSAVARTIVGYDLFIPGTLTMKDQAEAVRIQTIRLHTLLASWTDISFALFGLSGIALIVRLRHLFRERGWMLMCSLLFLLMLPAGGWTAWEDYHAYTLFDRVTGVALAPAEEIINVFLRRQQNVAFGVLSGLTGLSAVSLILIGAFRPLHRS